MEDITEPQSIKLERAPEWTIRRANIYKLNRGGKSKQRRRKITVKRKSALRSDRKKISKLLFVQLQGKSNHNLILDLFYQQTS